MSPIKAAAPSSLSAAGETATVLPFILRNENFAFDERTVAVIIDAGEGVEIKTSDLDKDDFTVSVHKEITAVNPAIVVDGKRTITNVYASKVNAYGTPSDSGRYIVLEFLSDYSGLSYEKTEEHDMDCGSTSHDGLNGSCIFDVYDYSIACNGTIGGINNPSFAQTTVISPVIDTFKYGKEGNTDYRYFINEDADGPLPLVLYFHGGRKAETTRCKFASAIPRPYGRLPRVRPKTLATFWPRQTEPCPHGRLKTLITPPLSSKNG